MRRPLLLCLFATACWHDSTKAPEPVEPKPRIKDIVQPVKIEKQELVGGEEGGGVDDPCGVVGGVVGGQVGGVGGGYPPPPPPPPPPPMPPQNIPPTLLEGQRIAGNKLIAPDDVTKTEIQRSGKDKIIGSWKLCITATGDVSQVSELKSTGFPDYDHKIDREMRNWRYRPYQVNGRDVPVCTAVTFIYSQPLPPVPSLPPPRKP